MKKLFVYFALVAFLAMPGCKKECQADYNWVLDVKNETEREITMLNNTGYGDYVVRIAAGQSGTMTGRLYGGSCDSNKPQEDHLTLQDALPYGDSFTTELSENKNWLSMTVGDNSVPQAIWQRKYWSFKSDNYNRIYTLTVTDEFLESLPKPGPGFDPGNVMPLR